MEQKMKKSGDLAESVSAADGWLSLEKDLF